MSTIKASALGPLTASNTATIVDPQTPAGGIARVGTLVSYSAVTASGTSVDFTGIPSWARRLTVLFNAVSITGTALYRMQLGSGSITTSGYNVSATYQGGTNGGTTSTSGFDIYGVGAAHSISGVVTFATLGSNIWVGSGVVGYSSQAYVFMTAGNVTLSGALDRIRFTTSTGTDTYDAGSINVMYE